MVNENNSFDERFSLENLFPRNPETRKVRERLEDVGFIRLYIEDTNREIYSREDSTKLSQLKSRRPKTILKEDGFKRLFFRHPASVVYSKGDVKVKILKSDMYTDHWGNEPIIPILDNCKTSRIEIALGNDSRKYQQRTCNLVKQL